MILVDLTKRDNLDMEELLPVSQSMILLTITMVS